jgi:ABC-type transporter Mla subunit MlaD
VGVFVVIALGLGVGIILWLGVADMFAPEGQVAVFYTPQSAGALGLKEGYDVNLGDQKIGKIIEVRLDAENHRCLYRVRLQRTDIQVRADARAAVDSPPLGMPKLVVYEIGSAEELASEEHPVELKPGGLTKAMTDLASVTDKLKNIAQRVQDELDPDRAEALLAKIHAILGDLQTASSDVVAIAGNVKAETDKSVENSLMAKLRQSMDDVTAITTNLRHETDPNAAAAMLAKVHRSIDDVNRVTSDVREMVSETRPKVTKITDNIVKTTENIEKYVSKDVAKILADVREANTKILKIAADFAAVSEETKQIIVLNRDNIDKIIDDMAQVSDNLKATSTEIRRNPWRLIHKPSEEEIETQVLYDAARAYSDGAASLNRALSKVKALHKEYPKGIDPNNPELPDIRKQLNRTFDRFQKVEQALWKELGKQQ